MSGLISLEELNKRPLSEQQTVWYSPLEDQLYLWVKQTSGIRQYWQWFDENADSELLTNWVPENYGPVSFGHILTGGYE